VGRPVKASITKTHIIEKAKAVFMQYGYTKTSMEDIAKAVGLNKASFYHYYANKQDLFFNVILNLCEPSLQQLLKDSTAKKGLDKQLTYYFTERLHLYIVLIKLHSINTVNLLGLQSDFDAVYDPIKQEEINAIAQLVKLSYPKNKLSLAWCKQLFYTVDAIKHHEIFVGKLLENETMATANTKEQIKNTIKIFLQTLKNNN
jgi:hypothetical protein